MPQILERIFVMSQALFAGPFSKIPNVWVPEDRLTLNTINTRQTPIDFKYVFYCFATNFRGEIMRLCILVNTRHPTGSIKKQHIQRNERVFHPKGDRRFIWIYKQHTTAFGHMIYMHQAKRAAFRCLCKSHIKAHLPPITAQIHPIVLAGFSEAFTGCCNCQDAKSRR